MAYRYSAVDNRNIQWMASDNNCATLQRIVLASGHLRSIGKFDILLNYPISAIAGENGSGKSTILAIAACAFHNNKRGYKLSWRNSTYYTFSDFFVQSSDEIPPQGIHIKYQIRHNNWRRIEPGPAWQSRKKRDGGKWSDYASRVARNVIYFGIQRIVPHYERSTHKSYRSYFRPESLDETIRIRIQQIAGRIIGRNYTDFEVHKHSKYSLPVATHNSVRYSGFNMGAGESAIFEILAALFESGRGTLLVIDEIELGLHEKSQRRFIHELKELCCELHCQIICSTHSHNILQELPPEGRFFIECDGTTSKVISGISADLACGKLSGRNTGEICLFVEDGAAQAILKSGLPHSIRGRVNILPIGSAEAVLRQLTSRYIENNEACLAILDGDKRSANDSNISKIAKYSEASTDDERENARRWGGARITYLPGDVWPEKWLIEEAQKQLDKSFLMETWRTESTSQVSHALEVALLAGKHNEFYQLAQEIGQDADQVRADVVRFVTRSSDNPLENIIIMLTELLE